MKNLKKLLGTVFICLSGMAFQVNTTISIVLGFIFIIGGYKLISYN